MICDVSGISLPCQLTGEHPLAVTWCVSDHTHYTQPMLHATENTVKYRTRGRGREASVGSDF